MVKNYRLIIRTFENTFCDNERLKQFNIAREAYEKSCITKQY